MGSSSGLFESNKRKRSLRRFFWMAKAWSAKTFGDKKPGGAAGSIQHLKREVEELVKKPKDLIEIADVMHLIFDIAWRDGYTYDDVIDACYAKLAINRERSWGKPDKDGVCEHVEPQRDDGDGGKWWDYIPGKNVPGAQKSVDPDPLGRESRNLYQTRAPMDPVEEALDGFARSSEGQDREKKCGFPSNTLQGD